MDFEERLNDLVAEAERTHSREDIMSALELKLYALREQVAGEDEPED